eukprot:SAG31_NODE_44594_length_262_cov_0.631902_1_plen_86_part_11
MAQGEKKTSRAKKQEKTSKMKAKLGVMKANKHLAIKQKKFAGSKQQAVHQFKKQRSAQVRTTIENELATEVLKSMPLGLLHPGGKG